MTPSKFITIILLFQISHKYIPTPKPSTFSKQEEDFHGCLNFDQREAAAGQEGPQQRAVDGGGGQENRHCRRHPWCQAVDHHCC